VVLKKSPGFAFSFAVADVPGFVFDYAVAE